MPSPEIIVYQPPQKYQGIPNLNSRNTSGISRRWRLSTRWCSDSVVYVRGRHHWHEPSDLHAGGSVRRPWQTWRHRYSDAWYRGL